MKIGLIPTRRDAFSLDEAKRYKALIQQMMVSMPICEWVDIDDINEEGILFHEQDVNAVVRKMREQEVVGLFFPHVNFGSEDLVSKVAKKLSVPVLIWGPRDDAPLADGVRTRDTQCGLFATGKVLRRNGVPFTYLTNCWLDDPVFTRGIRRFCAVCLAKHEFSRTRILQISTRPAGFHTMICNEGELLERFGISVVPISLVDMETGVRSILATKGSDYRLAEEIVYERFDCSHISGEALQTIIALKAWMTATVSENHYSAIAMQCWHAMQKSLGIMPCAANGLMTDEMVPVTCETDIHGAISSIMLQAAGLYRTPVFFADLTVRHPTNDQAELLWHCGNFPSTLAGNDRLDLGNHFIFPSHCAGTGEFSLKDGDLTICRFDGDRGEYRLLFGEGQSVEGPKTRGTYVWMEVNDLPALEKKIVEGPYVHHCSGIHGRISEILWECCKYIDGLAPDPFGMDEADLAKRWMIGSNNQED